MQKKLDVSRRSRNRRPGDADSLESRLRCRRGDPNEDCLVYRRVSDDPVLADFFPSRLELRLHERHDVRVRRQKWRQRWEDMPQGDECHIYCDQIDGPWHVISMERTRVDAL